MRHFTPRTRGRTTNQYNLRTSAAHRYANLIAGRIAGLELRAAPVGLRLRRLLRAVAHRGVPRLLVVEGADGRERSFGDPTDIGVCFACAIDGDEPVVGPGGVEGRSHRLLIQRDGFVRAADVLEVLRP